MTYKFADGTLYQSFDLQFEKGAIVDASDLIMLPDNMNFADDFLYYEVRGNGLDTIQRVVEKTTTHQETQTDNPITSDSGTQTELPKEEEKQSNKDNVKEQPKKELGSRAKRNKKAKEQSSVQSDTASVKRLPKTGNQADQALLLSGLASIGLSTGILFKRKKEQ